MLADLPLGRPSVRPAVTARGTSDHGVRRPAGSTVPRAAEAHHGSTRSGSARLRRPRPAGDTGRGGRDHPVPAARLRRPVLLALRHRAIVRLADQAPTDRDGSRIGLPGWGVLLPQSRAGIELAHHQGGFSAGGDVRGTAGDRHPGALGQVQPFHVAFWLWAALYFTTPFLVAGV